MAPNHPEKQPARGRNVASKPLNPSAAAPKVRSGPANADSGSSRASSATSSSARSTSAADKAASSSRASSKRSESRGFKVTKLSSTTVTLNTSWTPHQSSSTSSEPPSTQAADQQQPPRTSDPLQVAAQVYPWAYMSSTLDACFDTAQASASTELETKAKEVSAVEAELSEQRDRIEAERALDLFEELGSSAFSKDAPEIMKLFHSHGDACAQIETEALKLAMNSSVDTEDEEPLKPYNDMLHALEELQNEATKLQDSITKLSESPSPDNATNPSTSDASEAHSQVSSVFASCLPVMRARIANLTMAQDLIDTALENISLDLRMESMGLV